MRKLSIALACLLLAGTAALSQQTSPGVAVSGVPVNRSTVNGSVTITTGNTFQSVLSSNLGTATPRQSLTIQNNNASDSCWLFIGATALATEGTSILLTAGASYTRYFPYIPSDNIAATCASSSDTLYVDTQ